VGWYYSTNNTQEPYTPATAYPYSRSLTASDGSTNVVRNTLAGDVFRAGAGRETVSGQFGVGTELDQYLTLRNKYFITSANAPTTQNSAAADLGQSVASLRAASLQQVAVTANGEKAITIQDKEGHAVASMRPATAADAWLTTQNSVDIGLPYMLRCNSSSQTSVASIISLTSALANSSLTTIVVYDGNDNLLYSGSPANFTPPAGGSFYITAGVPFRLVYRTLPFSLEPTIVTEESGTYVINSFHNFYTLAPGAVSITSSAASGNYDYVLLNMAADPAQADVTAAFKANPSQLPAGFYRLLATKGQVTLTYTNRYKDISYSFYNQLGQVVGSLAPNGVKKVIDDLAAGGTGYASTSALPFFTSYEYDQQGRLTASTETDAGRTEYAYRTDGKLRFSQNAKQRSRGYFSYVNYDAVGRVVETGECQPSSTTYLTSIRTDATVLDYVPVYGGFAGGFDTRWFMRADVVQTVYDIPTTNFTPPSGYTQANLSGRVSATVKYSSLGLGIITETAHSIYSYDEQGRVSWLAKQAAQQPTRTVDYTYDLAGKVRTVCYQQGTPVDRLTHYYTYDADQRLVKVETNKELPTTTAAVRTEHARYEYYLHGPLKRVVYNQNLQGVDYTYTAQGWLKGINSEQLPNDPGGDGSTQPTKPDLFGTSLHYYSDPTEYTSRAMAGKTTYASTSFANDNSRYDGTLSATGWQTQPGNINTYSYRYDYKSQLAKSDYGRLVDLGSVSAFVSNGGQYQESNLTYDPNGNLTYLKRTDGAGWSTTEGQYNYENNSTTNKLKTVTNGSQTIISYGYDELGQMTSQQEPQSPTKNKYLQYDMSGKVTAVYRDPSYSQLIAQYTYDEAGQRLSQQVYDAPPATTYTTTYFVRDAAGSELATYIYSSTTGQTALYEQPIYGAARLGVYRQPRDQEPAQQLYELNDQLGNTRIVFREPTSETLVLTMEGATQKERDDFSDPSPATYNAVQTSTYNHGAGMFCMGLLKQPGLERGPGRTVLMQRGDKLDVSVFAGYPDQNGVLTRTMPRLLIGLGIANASQPAPSTPSSEGKQPQPGWQQALSKVSLGIALPLSAKVTAPLAKGVPQAWLQYTVTRADNGQFVRNDIAYISARAEGTWEQLQLSLEITEDYPVKVEVSTWNGDGVTMVYFDDMSVTQTTGMVVQENHFYPYGQRNEGISWTRQYLRNYGRGYQGQYTRFDEETGYTAFDLRMYDARFGRWLSTDPKRQYVSPYIGMGNNPVSSVDPDGGSTNSTEVWYNESTGKYQVSGGNLKDGDLNIYVVSIYGVRTGEILGRSLFIDSFYNADYTGDNKWMGTIDPHDFSGANFLLGIRDDTPSLEGYVANWKGYNYKALGYDKTKDGSFGNYTYRAGPVNSFLENNHYSGNIYASGRDIGNIAAGYVAGKSGMTFPASMGVFQRFQAKQNGNIFGNGDESHQTRMGESLGWRYGNRAYNDNSFIGGDRTKGVK
jgi:RHS repeat-associated protein